jgi:lauroyl/myristoyl acyltransferase
MRNNEDKKKGHKLQVCHSIKMMERQTRAITTNIFHGLRKHGGYLLSPRADINEVLRELAKEAGWVVLPDDTTYRSSSPHVSSLLFFLFFPSIFWLTKQILCVFSFHFLFQRLG